MASEATRQRRPHPAEVAAATLREAAPRLNYESDATAAVLFNGLRNAGWSEEDILSTLRFSAVPPLRLRHPQHTAGTALTSIRHAGSITHVVFAADASALFSCSDAGEIIRWGSCPTERPHSQGTVTSNAITQCVVLPDSPEYERHTRDLCSYRRSTRPMRPVVECKQPVSCYWQKWPDMRDRSCASPSRQTETGH